MNFLPLLIPFFFSWFRNPLSLPNTINESVSIARLTISLVILCIMSFDNPIFFIVSIAFLVLIAVLT